MSMLLSCCLYSKGKNFRANHNFAVTRIYIRFAVAYIAKVRILEQITTQGIYNPLTKELLLI